MIEINARDGKTSATGKLFFKITELVLDGPV